MMASLNLNLPSVRGLTKQPLLELVKMYGELASFKFAGMTNVQRDDWESRQAAVWQEIQSRMLGR